MIWVKIRAIVAILAAAWFAVQEYNSALDRATNAEISRDTAEAQRSEAVEELAKQKLEAARLAKIVAARRVADAKQAKQASETVVEIQKEVSKDDLARKWADESVPSAITDILCKHVACDSEDGKGYGSGGAPGTSDDPLVEPLDDKPGLTPASTRG